MSESHPLLGTVSTVDISLIDTDDDRRPLYPDHIEELKKSISEVGLINPIALYHPPTRQRMKLMAGRHRYHACRGLGLTVITARVYDRQLSDYELKAIELYENIHRKNLTGPELSQQTERLHAMMQKIYGPSVPGKSVGHALKDTARMLGKSVGSVHGDIQLAKAIEQFPQLNLDKIENKSTALKVLHRFASTILNQEAARNIPIEGSKAGNLVASFKVGDFFLHGYPAETFSIAEIDPPYGIDLSNIKQGMDKGRMDAYNEIDKLEYPDFLLHVLSSVHSLLTANAWAILWHSAGNYQLCMDTLTSCGFVPNPIPGIWQKPNGQTNSPDTNLANSYESFIYARKGSPKLHLRGRPNVFSYAPATQKIHPTERPVTLIQDILNTFGFPGQAVLCPFLGSGNTILAAHMLNMKCVGSELTKSYHDAFVARVMSIFKN